MSYEWIPSKKQAQIYNDEIHRYIHAIGDPRSGKSLGFFQKAWKDLQLQPGIHGLITRDTGTSLLMFTYPQFREIINESFILDEGIKPYPWLQFKNGSEVSFIPYEEIDISKAGGSEYGFVLIDEATRFSRKQWDYMDTRLSQRYGTAIAPDRKKYRNPIKHSWLGTTGNPAGRGWTWKVYSTEHPLSYLNGDKDYRAWKFLLEDNKANLPKKYIEAMEAKPEHIRRKILGANEEPMEGLVFPEFSRELNVCKKRRWIPPTHWRVYGGMDQGFQTPTVFLWMAISPEGFLVFFHEYRKSHQTISENAVNIIIESRQLFNAGMSWVEGARIDPSTNMQDGKSGSTKTTYELYREAGLSAISLQIGKRQKVKDRVDRMRDLLRPDPEKKVHPITKEIREEGWPTVIFTEDCDGDDEVNGVKAEGGTISEFEEWEIVETNNSRKNSSEQPEQKDDHGIDAAMYAVQVYYGENSPEDPVEVRKRQSDPKEILRNQVFKRIEMQLNPQVAPKGALQGSEA